ncbi:MAG: LysM peptidoglycan-binding domain-containing protein [Sphingobacteriia bacterium]|nr:LysM peptidoglycan-binding domain-containing protein [Sphingobacteriia bacterium]
MISQNRHSFIAVILPLLLLVPGCTFFKSAGKVNNSSIYKDNSAEQFEVFSESMDMEEETKLFSEEDFNQYYDYETDTITSDSTFFVEIFAQEDSLVKFSNLKMNDSKIAGELLKESRTLYMLDSLVNARFFGDDKALFERDKLNIYHYAENEVPVFHDSVYAARIASMNLNTPLEFTFNATVKNFIELYGVKKRALTARILGLAEVYFPMFEEIFDQYDIPLEIKYLAVVESALNPVAGSRAGAKGLWQFMYGTGKMYGLQSNSIVDDRYDPYKSTIAAARHLKDLYDIYQDWWLAMAAYNSGGGNVNKAIRRAGGIKNYWAVWPYLPRETRGYVPAFIAVAYVMNHAAEHNIFPVHPGILYHAIDTVQVYDVLSFDQISEILSISEEDLRYLNPSFKDGIIPATSNNKYVLRLPRTLTGYFVSKEEEIYNHKTQKGIEKEKLLALVKEAQQAQIHIVKKGETLGGIARRYNTSVSRIQSWNNLRNTMIRPGQKLVVRSSTPISNTTAQKSGNENGGKIKHKVRRGENLGSIASKYNCTVKQLKRWNNLNSNTIYPNQTLVINGDNSSANSGNHYASGTGEGYIYYVVQPGDTLWEIAKKYRGVSVEDLKRINNLRNSNSIKPGQKLKIVLAG